MVRSVRAVRVCWVLGVCSNLHCVAAADTGALHRHLHIMQRRLICPPEEGQQESLTCHRRLGWQGTSMHTCSSGSFASTMWASRAGCRLSVLWHVPKVGCRELFCGVGLVTAAMMAPAFIPLVCCAQWGCIRLVRITGVHTCDSCPMVAWRAQLHMPLVLRST